MCKENFDNLEFKPFIETPDDVAGYDELEINEVACNSVGIKLFEFDLNDDIADIALDEDKVKEVFPDFIIKEGKGYVLGNENGLYI